MARSITSNVIVPEVLTQNNYEDWSSCVQNYLLAQNLWDVVESTHVPPSRKGAATWKRKNAAVLHILQISCAPETFAHIRGLTFAKDAWERLTEIYRLRQKSQFLRSGPQSREGLELSEVVQWFQGIIQGTSECIERKCYLPLLKAIYLQRDWDYVKTVLCNHQPARSARFLRKGATILNMVIAIGDVEAVKNLVDIMSEDELETQDHEGNTALAIAAVLGTIEIAECLIKNDNELLKIADKNGMIPVVKACAQQYKDMTNYLYTMTQEFLVPEHGDHCSLLLHFCMVNKMLDIAWDLLKKYPRLAFIKNQQGSTPIVTLSVQPSLFHSGCELSFVQGWIYSCMRVNPALLSRPVHVSITPNEQNEQNDIKNQVPCHQRGLNLLQEFFGIKHLYDQKLIHRYAVEILCCMSKELAELNAEELVESGVIPAFFQAVQHGILEFVDEMGKNNPDLFSCADEHSRNAFMYAIEYRQEKLFLKQNLSKQKVYLLALRDKDNNNVLHMAAKFAPDSRFAHISGPALQMQRELQWFKELEILVPECKDFVNHSGETPQQVFSRDHKQLKKEGEEWMKQTAQSYTVVCALIVTIVFAAAFTVPGGSNQDSGIPIFLHRRLFMVFILSDAISLFSASTSVLMFLGILTSRYAEEDFLKSLPTKLVIGLCTLFISIATMMIAFSAAVSLLLQGRWWVIISLVLFAGIPVIVFLLLQSRLLTEIFCSTYGPGIFDRPKKKDSQ
ncbi:hypothetical protein SLA2020_474990 [Shorea laevis]